MFFNIECGLVFDKLFDYVQKKKLSCFFVFTSN